MPGKSPGKSLIKTNLTNESGLFPGGIMSSFSTIDCAVNWAPGESKPLNFVLPSPAYLDKVIL